MEGSRAGLHRHPWTRLCVHVSYPRLTPGSHLAQSSRLFTTPKWVECNHGGACPIRYECDGRHPSPSGIQGPCISNATTTSRFRLPSLLVFVPSRDLPAFMSACLPAWLSCPDLPSGAVLQQKRKTGGLEADSLVSELRSLPWSLQISRVAPQYAHVLRATLHHTSKAKQDLQPRGTSGAHTSRLARLQRYRVNV